MATYSGSDKRIKYLFENGGGGGSSSLAGLDDVNLSSPTDGQVLTYNNGDWVNANGGGSGSGGMCYLNTMYSETEQKVGYWIDGKPLYAKTIHKEYNELVDYGIRKCVSLDVANTSIKYVEATATSATYGRAYLGTEDYASDNTDSNYMKVNSYYSMVAVSIGGTGANWNDYQPTVDATFYYTKNSDTADPHPQNGGVIYLPTIYSEEEREVGVWTDGKPLYQKTYAGLSLDCPIANTWYNTNILLGDIDVITSAELIDDNRQYIAGVVGTMSERTYLGVYLSIAGRTITTITIQYTKTTDTAGSGSWTPSGAPAVHYSTNEQAVGTWIDGKTLYEATIEVNNPTKQTFGNYYSYDANYSGHNIDYVQCVAKQCHDSHDQRWYDLPYHRLIDTESILCQAMKLDSTGQYNFAVFFRTSEQYNIDKIRYTIQYTKSS